VPELISRIVYDSAYSCVDLPSCEDYLRTPEGCTSLALTPDIMRGVVGDPASLGALRMNWRSSDSAFLDAAKAAFMAEGSDAEFLAMLNSLRPDDRRPWAVPTRGSVRRRGAGFRAPTSATRPIVRSRSPFRTG
jgi:hypothetical protein